MDKKLSKRTLAFVNIAEFQQKVLDYIGTDEIDKMISGTVFEGKPECKSSFVQGMAIASLLTCSCDVAYLKEGKTEDEIQEEELEMYYKIKEKYGL